MWNSVSGKLILFIIAAIIGIFIVRIMVKRGFNIVKPTWLGVQQSTATTAQAQQVGLPVVQYPDTFRGDL
jgi:archaellum component FlaG (FlaF/FlaG flagellin family)